MNISHTPNNSFTGAYIVIGDNCQQIKNYKESIDLYDECAFVNVNYDENKKALLVATGKDAKTLKEKIAEIKKNHQSFEKKGFLDYLTKISLFIFGETTPIALVDLKNKELVKRNKHTGLEFEQEKQVLLDGSHAEVSKTGTVLKRKLDNGKTIEYYSSYTHNDNGFFGYLNKFDNGAPKRATLPDGSILTYDIDGELKTRETKDGYIFEYKKGSNGKIIQKTIYPNNI